MAKWRKKGIFLEPLFKMKCRGCRDPYATFKEMGYGLSNFPIDAENPSAYGSYVIDRTYACKLCGFASVYGVAISKEHFEEILKYDAEKGRGEQKTARYLQFCEMEKD